MPETDSSLILEACVDSLDEALAAERRGANRIELCSALDLDGLTPSVDLARRCVDSLAIPVMAMVRPRAGGFVYSAAEVSLMEESIDAFKRAGVAGVVFGLLTEDGRVDIENTKRLLRAAALLEVTFHKAIDHSSDVMSSFRTLNRLDGISRVLTSGGCDTAWNGRDVLRAMNELPGRRIGLIAAGKILPENRREIAAYTGIRELHGRRIV